MDKISNFLGYLKTLLFLACMWIFGVKTFAVIFDCWEYDCAYVRGKNRELKDLSRILNEKIK